MDPKASLDSILSELKAEYEPTPQTPSKKNSSPDNNQNQLFDQLDRDSGLSALLKDINKDSSQVTQETLISKESSWDPGLNTLLKDLDKDASHVNKGMKETLIPERSNRDPSLKALLKDIDKDTSHVSQGMKETLTPERSNRDPSLKALLKDIDKDLDRSGNQNHLREWNQESFSPGSSLEEDRLLSDPRHQTLRQNLTTEYTSYTSIKKPQGVKQDPIQPEKGTFSQSTHRQEGHVLPTKGNPTPDKPLQESTQQKQIWTKKAQSWLKTLTPDSFEADWFEVYAQSYPSRLEAAISYLQGMAKLEISQNNEV
jgi:hypothetical protein